MFLLVWPQTLFPDGPGCCDDISRNAPTVDLAGGCAVDENLNPAQVGWTYHGAISFVDELSSNTTEVCVCRTWRGKNKVPVKNCLIV